MTRTEPPDRDALIASLEHAVETHLERGRLDPKSLDALRMAFAKPRTRAEVFAICDDVEAFATKLIELARAGLELSGMFEDIDTLVRALRVRPEVSIERVEDRSAHFLGRAAPRRPAPTAPGTGLSVFALRAGGRHI